MSLTIAPYEECRTWAAYWAQHWFLDASGRDRLRIDGIDVGWATHVEAYAALHDVALSVTGAPESAFGPGIRAMLKARGMDRSVRAWGLRISNARARSDTYARGAPLMVTEIPTPSMTQSSIEVALAIRPPTCNVAVADPRALNAWREAGFRPSYLIADLKKERRVLHRARSLRSQINAVLADLPPMDLAGIDIRAVAQRRLESMLRRSVPWLLVEATAVSALLDRVQPRSVAVASDQHRIGRLLVHASSQRAIPVTVLQHGLPQAEVGYLPVVGAHVAAWSEGSSDWFIRGGTDPARMVVTGNPQFDRLRAGMRGDERAALDHQYSNRDDLRLLLAVSPTSRQTNISVLRRVCSAMVLLPGAFLVIKLHPGYRDWQFVSDVLDTFPDLKSRIRVAHRVPLAPLLAWAQVTLVHQSTVALDSLAVRTPVLLVPLEDSEAGAAHVGLVGMVLPTAVSAAEIAEAASELARIDPDIALSDDLSYWLGPQDGKSASRISEILRSAD